MKILLLAVFVGYCWGLTPLEENVLEAMKEAEKIIVDTNQNVKTMPDDQLHMQTNKANEESHQEGQRGDWLAETTKLLVKKYGMDILQQLETIDVTKLMPPSPREKRQTRRRCRPDSISCTNTIHTNYRSVTGVCNNRVNRDFGRSVSPIRRLLNNASYEDGVGAYRTRSVTGPLLPSAREISNRLHSERLRPTFDRRINHFHQQFGQFIAHDIIFTPSATGPNGQTIDCSSCESVRMSQNCAPIRVPDGDLYFRNNSCIRLTRSLNGQRGLGQRIQINQNTHFLDLSDVYGSEACEAASVRSFRNGELLEFRVGQTILPPQAPNDTNCQSRRPNFCFLAGDFRNSLHPGLIPLHVLYIKLHNAIARNMKALQPTWSDERAFQEARRMSIALYQHHVFQEYLPKLLGTSVMAEFGLLPRSGVSSGYNETINPALTAEFLSAFRFGHSQVRNNIPGLQNNGSSTGSLALGSNIFYADAFYGRQNRLFPRQSNYAEQLLDGMIQSSAMSVDKVFTFPMRNQMFELRGQRASGVDMAATNVMRTRDAGLFPYNVYRVVAGLPRANNFEDLAGQISQENIDALKSVYAHVDDVDFYSAMLMERPVNLGLIGRTGAYLLADGFRGLKYGDRFFYEWQVPGTRSLTAAEFSTVRSISLATVACKMTNQMELVNQDIFDRTSPRVNCSLLPNIDVQAFVNGAVARFGRT